MAVRLAADLLEEYRKNKISGSPERLIFHGVEGFDVYNPTAVFPAGGRRVLCGRVEKRDREESRAVFFAEREGNHFYPIPDLPSYPLQDPFVTRISGYYIFGGTFVAAHPDKPGAVMWHTRFYYGTSLSKLSLFLEGPEGMKDVRLVELPDGRVGVFSRPQGKKGGRGKIGFTVAEDIFSITGRMIEEAPLLTLFDDAEWGGVNEPVLLPDGRIGVLGHIAGFSGKEIRHYYPAAFTLDPLTGNYSDLKIIAERSDFLPGPAKRPDLEDVLFSGGCIRRGDGTAELYVGVSDCEVQKTVIQDPFSGV